MAIYVYNRVATDAKGVKNMKTRFVKDILKLKVENLFVNSFSKMKLKEGYDNYFNLLEQDYVHFEDFQQEYKKIFDNVKAILWGNNIETIETREAVILEFAGKLLKA